MKKVKRLTSDPVMSKLMDRLGKFPEEKGPGYLKALKAVIKRIDQKADPIASGKVKGYRYKGNLKEFLKER